MLCSLFSLQRPHCISKFPRFTHLLRCCVSSSGLDLSSCTRVGDGSAAHLSVLSRLAALKLSNCQQLSNTGVARLSGLHGLVLLHLDRCAAITDEALAQLARLTGLTSIRMSR